jgi:serine/threonine protein kinase
MRPQVGQVINNKYRLVRAIGDGGMGSVFEARHEMLGTSVALKFLHPELTKRAGLVQRFLQEAKVSAQIQSPHVVRVSDVDQSPQGLAFIVLEYLEGRTLQTLYEDLYKAGQRLSYADALEYAMQMIEGVEAAHKAGIVHRDLKPDNVMITIGPKGAPLLKLLDFGIAKLKVTGELDRGLTRPGVIMGTPEYMAPEQAYSADQVDARADIFSLGVMIFEMLAGRRPVGGDDPHEIATAYLNGRVARLGDLVPGIAPELAAAVHKAMAPLARDRFASASELRDAIEPFALAVRPPQQSRPSLVGPTPAPGPVSPSPGALAAFAVGATPAQGSPNGDAPRAVPKTLPPEDEAPAGGGTGGTVEVVFSEQAPRLPPGATPLGGFSPVGAQPWAETNAAAPLPMPIAAQPSAGALGATETSPPFKPNGGDRTDYASPLQLTPRPGGTAVGAAGYNGSHTSAGAPDFNAGFGAGTVPMDQAYGAPAANIAAPAFAPEPRRKARSAPPLLLILLLAGGIAGAVVGGVYAANYYAKLEDHADDPKIIAPITPATVPSDPATTPPPPPEQPGTPPTTPPVKPQPGPVQPKPKPSGTALPGPQPSGTATVPPPMIPSVLPFPIPTIPGIPGLGPFGPVQGSPGASAPGGQTPPPGGSSTAPGGTTTPPAGSGSGRRGPIIIRIPGR